MFEHGEELTSTADILRGIAQTRRTLTAEMVAEFEQDIQSYVRLRPVGCPCRRRVGELGTRPTRPPARSGIIWLRRPWDNSGTRLNEDSPRN
jgi:hypothetical protein